MYLLGALDFFHIQEAHRQDGGRHPRSVLALAALDVAGRGDAVTSASILRTLQDGVHRHGPGASSGVPEGIASSSTPSGAAGASRGALRGSRRALAAENSPEDPHMSFGSVAKRNIGGS